MDSRIKFMHRLRLARSESGLTFQQIGDRVGVTKAAVSQWMNGVTVPNAFRVEPLCDALGVEVAWLLGKSKRRRQA